MTRQSLRGRRISNLGTLHGEPHSEVLKPTRGVPTKLLPTGSP